MKTHGLIRNYFQINSTLLQIVSSMGDKIKFVKGGIVNTKSNIL